MKNILCSLFVLINSSVFCETLINKEIDYHIYKNRNYLFQINPGSFTIIIAEYYLTSDVFFKPIKIAKYSNLYYVTDDKLNPCYYDICIEGLEQEIKNTSHLVSLKTKNTLFFLKKSARKTANINQLLHYKKNNLYSKYLAADGGLGTFNVDKLLPPNSLKSFTKHDLKRNIHIHSFPAVRESNRSLFLSLLVAEDFDQLREYVKELSSDEIILDRNKVFEFSE